MSDRIIKSTGSDPAHVVEVSGRQIVTYGSIYGVEDSDGDIMATRWADRWLSVPMHKSRVKILNQHDKLQPLAKPQEMWSDERGLLAKFTVSDTSYGRDLQVLYKDGVIDEHSFVADKVVRDKSDNRIIAEARIWEISPVTFAANAGALVQSVKSRSDQLGAIERDAAFIRKALQSGVSDEFGRSLEAILKAWETIVAQPDDNATNCIADLVAELELRKAHRTPIERQLLKLKRALA